MCKSFIAGLFVFLCSSSFASIKPVPNDLDISFDKESYYPGERAKVVIVTKKLPSNSDFDFTVDVIQKIGAISSDLSLQEFGNIAIGTTEKLGKGSSLDIILKLKNSKKIKNLQAKISNIKFELIRLREDFRETNNSSILEMIAQREREIEFYKKQIRSETTVVKRVSKKVNVIEVSCDFFATRELEIPKSPPVPTPLRYTEVRSHFFDVDGAIYEVRFTTNIKDKPTKRKIRQDPFALELDQCIEEEDPDSTDYLYPSWTIGREKNPLHSTYEESARCFRGPDPVACKVSYNISAGPCDGRHSETHSGSRPLGYIKGGIENHIYDVPATKEGLPYTYIAPDVAGDVRLEFTFYLPDVEEPVVIPYLLRVGLTHLVDLKDTPFLSKFLTFNNITSHPGNGTYGVENFGFSLFLALQAYVTEANNFGIPNASPGPFYPLNSEGVSLQFGGLFDTDKNWKDPHYTHRQGVDIDIGMSLLKAHTHFFHLMNILDRNLKAKGLSIDVPYESIRATPKEKAKPFYHWHVKYPFGALVK